MAVNRYYSSTAVDTTLASGMSSSDITLIVSSTQGFPISYPYTLAVDYDTSKEELINIVGASGTTLTVGTTVGTASIIGRAVDGTQGGTGVTHDAGAVVKHVISGRDMREAQEHIAATTSVHGIADTSAIATKTGTETLTNKTLTAPTVTNGTFTAPTITGPAVTNGTFTSPTITGTIAGNPTFTGTVTLPTSITGATGAITTAMIADGAIVNADVNASAAIATSKIDGTASTLAFGTNASAITANGATISATELGYLDGVTSAIQTQFSALEVFPKGMVSPFAGSSAPSGWLLCDGSAKSTVTNPEYAGLFSTIGNTYGGTNNTDFKVPDLRGRAPIGVGTGTGLTARALAATVGAESVTLTSAQSGMPGHGHGNTLSITGDGSHSHTLTMRYTSTSTHDHAIAGASNPLPAMEGDPSSGNISNSNFTAIGNTGHSHSLSGGVSDAAGVDASAAHTNMQPSLALNYIIKY
jgi:microcystin-dependent protein